MTACARLLRVMEICLAAGCRRVRLTFDWLKRKVCVQEIDRSPVLRFRLGAGVLVDGPDPSITPDAFAIQGENMNVVLPDTHQFPVSISVVDAKGNPAEVQGTPAWASSDDGIAVVVPASDGKSAVVAATGPLGTCQITVTADADLGDGVTNISGLLDVTVVAGAAVGISLAPGPTEPQP